MPQQAARTPSPTGIMALQRSARNSAVVATVQQFRGHGAGCGHAEHETADPAESVQRKSTVHKVLNSSGSPMDTELREEMEYRYDGADFSGVVMHTGAEADQSAQEIGAEAYTSERHIVFRKGVEKNKSVVAHELQHYLDQQQGTVPGVDNGDGLSISEVGDPGERRADASSARVMSKPMPGDLDAEPVGPSVQRSRSAFAAEHAVTGGQAAWGPRSRNDLSGVPARSGGDMAGAPVQRMFSGLFNRGAQANQERINVRGQDVLMTREREYWTFPTAAGGTGFIYEDVVRDGAVSADMAGYVQTYLNGGNLTLYRGIARWHPTWHTVAGEAVVPPLGQGRLPDFDTHNTSFVPFSPSQTVAKSALVGASGMGEKDKAQYVEGYSRADDGNEVGMMVTTVATSAMDLGFYNVTEIQIRGPVPASGFQIFTMASTEQQVLGIDSQAQMRDTRPPTPDEAQKQDYIGKFGNLIP